MRRRIITDFYPIFGYKRKYYLLFCGIIFCVVWLILGFLKINSFLTVICLFISNLTCCFSTVLSQATMIEIGSKMDKNEEKYPVNKAKGRADKYNKL